MAFTFSTGSSNTTYQASLGGAAPKTEPYDLYVSAATGTTFTPQTSLLVITASGTLATATVQLPSNAIDGQRLRIICNKAVTALTMTAGTNATGASDTISDAATALVANTAVEYVYALYPADNQASTAANLYTWYRVQ